MQQEFQATMGQLARVPPDLPLTVEDLAQLFGRCAKSVQRAAGRGELPSGFRLMGRQHWTARAILEHFARLQQEAQEADSRREKRFAQLRP